LPQPLGDSLISYGLSGHGGSHARTGGSVGPDSTEQSGSGIAALLSPLQILRQ